jgi:hypothetical protein
MAGDAYSTDSRGCRRFIEPRLDISETLFSSPPLGAEPCGWRLAIWLLPRHERARSPARHPRPIAHLLSARSGKNRTLMSRPFRRTTRQRRRLRPSAASTSMNASGSRASFASVIRAPVSDRSKTIQCSGRVPRPQSIRAGRCNRTFRKRSGMNAKKHRREQQQRYESSNGYGVSPITHYRSPHRFQPQFLVRLTYTVMLHFM